MTRIEECLLNGYLLIGSEMDQDTVGQVVAITYHNRVYDHYAILDGNGGAIHVNKKKGLITLDPLNRVLRGASEVKYIDDDFDTRWLIYQRAIPLVGSKHSYRFFTDNCESWVGMIRTGTAYSKQADQALDVTSAIILGVSGIMALSGL